MKILLDIDHGINFSIHGKDNFFLKCREMEILAVPCCACGQKFK
jgi:hypothetical protein